MHKLRIQIGVLVLLGLGIGIAAQTPYRLAGIIAPDKGSALALIEMPDGEQQLFRIGDAIEAGRVAEITADTVRLEFPEEVVVLQLAGTGNPVSNAPVEYRQKDYMAAGAMPVDTGNLDAISQLASSAEAADSKKLATQVLTYLDLPPAARIMAINDEPVDSVADAVRKMAQNIDAKAGSGFQFVLSIAEKEGNKRVYVTANDTGQMTDQTIRAD